jgi:hypothetical protein
MRDEFTRARRRWDLYTVSVACTLACGGGSNGPLFDHSVALPTGSTDGASELLSTPATSMPDEAESPPPGSANTADGSAVSPTDPAAGKGSAGAAAGSSSVPSAAAPPPAVVPPSEVPEVLWTTPQAGETGVHAGADIELQFNEPMDIASVEAALVTNLPDTPALSWEGGGTLLRIQPSAALPYGDTSAPALAFTLSIDGTARSSSGQALPAMKLSFSTLRRVHLSLVPLRDPALTGGGSSAPPLSADAGPEPAPAALPASCKRKNMLCVGDNPDAPNTLGDSLQLAAFLTFDLSPLPAGVELEAAQIGISLHDTSGNPFGQGGLGSLHVERTWFSEIDAAAVSADPDATLAVLAADMASVTSGDISWVIEEARDSGITQYRLRFPQNTNRDGVADLALFDATAQSLELTYLIP